MAATAALPVHASEWLAPTVTEIVWRRQGLGQQARAQPEGRRKSHTPRYIESTCIAPTMQAEYDWRDEVRLRQCAQQQCRAEVHAREAAMQAWRDEKQEKRRGAYGICQCSRWSIPRGSDLTHFQIFVRLQGRGRAGRVEHVEVGSGRNYFWRAGSARRSS